MVIFGGHHKNVSDICKITASFCSYINESPLTIRTEARKAKYRPVKGPKPGEDTSQDASVTEANMLVIYKNFNHVNMLISHLGNTLFCGQEKCICKDRCFHDRERVNPSCKQEGDGILPGDLTHCQGILQLPPRQLSSQGF